MKKIIIILLLSFWNISFSQEPNDCLNAITICGNGTFSSNASGFGTIQEVSGCGGMEHNSIWIKINIVQSGTLGFNIIPNDPDLTVDYDFWVYNPNASCSGLGSPIRCATTNPLQSQAAGNPVVNNHTGMYGATTTTQLIYNQGIGYVRWLDVVAGQSYYIAIDRPVGDGGFDLEWTGTAMNGTGAFAPPPTANDIVDMRTCSNNPNVGIFDLNTARPLINADLVNNTITFHTTLENAFDNVAPIGPIMGNASNPQQIFARVTNNVTGCSTITDFDLKVFPVPTATISASQATICSGAPVDITITGTPESTIDYTVNGGAIQSATLDITGTFTLTANPIIDTEYTLVGAKILGFNNTVICSQAINDDVTVVVTPNVTPTFTQVFPICEGEILSALPTTSTNGITGTWSPALDNTSTTTYTFTPDAGVCATTTTMEIVVNPTQIATFNPVAPICQGEPLSALPTTSTNGITGSWSPALDNTATTTYTFTPDAGQCSNAVAMEIVVNPTQIATFNPVAPICEGETLSALPTTSIEGITGSWSPALDNTTTTTYTFTPDAGQCANTVSIQIIVNPTQIATFTPVPPICPGETLSALPTTSIEGITGSWSPALDNTTTTIYTFTPDAGQCSNTATMQIEVNPSQAPTFTQVNPICQGETLSALPTTSNNGITGTWSPALDNNATTTYTFTPDAGQCSSSVSMEIVVNPTQIATFTQVAPICQGETLSALPTTSDNGITGTWSPALDNTTTTTYTFTPDAGQCANAVTMEIIVNPTQIATFTQVAPICQGETLSALPTISTNGVTGTWSPALNNNATTTYTFTPDAGQCSNNIQMQIVVNPYPILASDEYKICKADGSGFGEFDLQGNIPVFLGTTQNPANFSVSFSRDALNANPITTNPYTNATIDSETIFITITNASSGCSITEPVNLIVESGTQVTQPADVAICDYEDENDGIATFNLEDFETEILNGQNPADFIITYHLSAFTAQTGVNAIQNPTEHKNTASPYLQRIFIRVVNINSTNACIGLTDVNLIVEPILKPRIITGPDNNNTICVNFETGEVERSLTLFSLFQNPSYTYKWFLNGTEIPGATSGSYEIITASPGLYTLEITDSSSTSVCVPEPSDVFEVIQSGSAVVRSVEITNAFNNENTITVEVEGFGEYWFQLDYGPIEDNGGIFTNVTSGLHTVHIYDRKTEKPSCDAVVIENIRIIDYPKFFTPNGDGYNDTWNIGGLDEQLKSKIFIFDRYGKLITEIKPSGDGWDGTFNANLLPATDYWFVIYYEEEGVAKEFKAHFSLKR
ncbi:gliding motility-associated-like protein [Flavobacterium arsenatis]|uniref:Gliding motility-associated-like protein n=1 Tax=Flavobacterium arsenatis TaxID=1484332 RepID=A0ABU1TMR9_9FLAO|nr:T9SS type B sorting domain-containing protein [Flavobacterium arsenatis]MDR6967261.1 gliding motility-associated-like protein [Flavobacterium arsenatis]